MTSLIASTFSSVFFSSSIRITILVDHISNSPSNPIGKPEENINLSYREFVESER